MHPILWHYGLLTIYSYGFCAALSVLVTFIFANFRAEKYQFSKPLVADLIFLLFVSGIFGARLFYVLQHFEDYRDQPLRMFAVSEGGLVWYGGFIVASLSAFLYAAVQKKPVLKLCDFFAPLLPLAHAFGRLGCFLNGCCYGRVTFSRFGVRFPGDDAPRYPVQLYEAFFLLVLSFFLFRVSRKTRRPGEIFIYYLLFYSLGRFLLEFLRGDNAPVFFLTIPQWTSVFLLAGSLCLLSFMRKAR